MVGNKKKTPSFLCLNFSLYSYFGGFIFFLNFGLCEFFFSGFVVKLIGDLVLFLKYLNFLLFFSLKFLYFLFGGEYILDREYLGVVVIFILVIFFLFFGESVFGYCSGVSVEWVF